CGVLELPSAQNRSHASPACCACDLLATYPRFYPQQTCQEPRRSRKGLWLTAPGLGMDDDTPEARVEYLRGVAEKLRGIANQLRFDLRRADQLRALADGF